MVVLTRKSTYRTTGNAAATAHRVLPFESVLMLALCIKANAHSYTCRLVWSCSGVVRKQFTTAQNILQVYACYCSNTRLPPVRQQVLTMLEPIQEPWHMIQLHCCGMPSPCHASWWTAGCVGAFCRNRLVPSTVHASTHSSDNLLTWGRVALRTSGL